MFLLPRTMFALFAGAFAQRCPHSDAACSVHVCVCCVLNEATILRGKQESPATQGVLRHFWPAIASTRASQFFVVISVLECTQCGREDCLYSFDSFFAHGRLRCFASARNIADAIAVSASAAFQCIRLVGSRRRDVLASVRKRFLLNALPLTPHSPGSVCLAASRASPPGERFAFFAAMASYPRLVALERTLGQRGHERFNLGFDPDGFATKRTRTWKSACAHPMPQCGVRHATRSMTSNFESSRTPSASSAMEIALTSWKLSLAGLTSSNSLSSPRGCNCLFLL